MSPPPQPPPSSSTSSPLHGTADVTVPIVRRTRHAISASRRRRDGLLRFANNVTSQNGEDGILARIFELIANPSPTTTMTETVTTATNTERWCVDVGAWDGRHLSNTYSLLVAYPSSSSGMKGGIQSSQEQWHGVLIEADKTKFCQLQELHQSSGNICIHQAVSCMPYPHPQSLVALLQSVSTTATTIPRDLDFLCIDIDGADYWVLQDLWENSTLYHPRVVCIEFNPTIPNDVVYIPPRDDTIRHGTSLAALVELAEQYDYVLVETTLYNAFFVTRELYETCFREEVPDPSMDALHEVTMGTSLYQLYDGTIKLWGCKKLLWHRIPIEESQLQILPTERRIFPFAPSGEALSSPTTVSLSSFTTPSSSWVPSPWDPSNITSSFVVIDVSPFVRWASNDEDDHRMSNENEDNLLLSQRMQCAKQLVQQLQKDGFCYVRGLGVSQELCQQTLEETDFFLQRAPENVRRSCLTLDRARRGYSPMNVENFASLIGERGPNDLVRKFRVGPLQDMMERSLLQPNVWPPSTVWERASIFQSTIEQYYERCSVAGQRLVQAICTGLVQEHPELEHSLEPLLVESNTAHTSILTLLGYRVGSRHRGKLGGKGPLVAAHTDVGVVTVLLFDSGDCAQLQRSDGRGGWADVTLPPIVPNDPIYVINVADCLSDLTMGHLPSTLHRVVAKPGRSQPRNGCALFVGLDPDTVLNFADGVTMTYEEWRKQRIERSQNVLRSQSG